MMAHFTAAWKNHPDPSVLGSPQEWASFATNLSQGHVADIQALEAQIQALRHELGSVRATQVPLGGATHGLSSKDLKPDKFESNKKSDQLFKQWSEDVRAWLRRVDPDCALYVKTAEALSEWSQVNFAADLVRQGMDLVKQQEAEENLADILRKFTRGEARDLVDTTSVSGEAWYRLKDRFHARTVVGATSIANRLQEFKRPTALNDSFALLTEIRGLVKEFQRQSPTEPMPTSMIKAAYMKVVPEQYKKGLEMQIDIDRSDVHVIEDKVMQFIRTNSSGIARMETNVLRKPTATWSAAHEGREHHGWPGVYHVDGECWEHGEMGGYHENHEEMADCWSCDANTFAKGKGKAKGKAKGKGKGEFRGSCYLCGAYGPSQKYCPNYSKGKGKAKGQTYQYGGKGYGGKNNNYQGKGMNFYGTDRVEDEASIPTLALEKHSPQRPDNGKWCVPAKTVKPRFRNHVAHKTFVDATLFETLLDEGQDDGDDCEATSSAERAMHESTEQSVVCGKAKRWRRVQGEHRPAKLVSILERGSRELCEMSQSGWVPLPMPLVVDSGAGETVMPADWLPAHPIKESMGSRSNEFYTTADAAGCTTRVRRASSYRPWTAARRGR